MSVFIEIYHVLKEQFSIRHICSTLAGILIVLLISLMSSCSSMNAPYIEFNRQRFRMGLNERCDPVQHSHGGAHLVLAYDSQSNAFKGHVENMTEKTLKGVRVEARLSNREKLGPMPAMDLAPSEKKQVELIPISKNFTGWTAHVEVPRSQD